MIVLELFLTIAAATLILISFTSRYMSHVLRMNRDGTIISDSSGWSVTMFNGTFWFAVFGPDWRKRYRPTMAVGYCNTHVWWYTPLPKRTKP